MTICDQKNCTSVKKNNIISIAIKETMFLCLNIVELKKSCIDTSIDTSIFFEVYKEGVDYSSQDLNIGNNL